MGASQRAPAGRAPGSWRVGVRAIGLRVGRGTSRRHCVAGDRNGRSRRPPIVISSAIEPRSASARSSSPTIVPPIRTSTRSARASTSSSSCDTKQNGATRRPHLADEAMDVAHPVDVDAPRRVGGDERPRGSASSSRPTTSRCWLPPDSVPAGVAGPFRDDSVALDNTFEPSGARRRPGSRRGARTATAVAGRRPRWRGAARRGRGPRAVGRGRCTRGRRGGARPAVRSEMSEPASRTVPSADETR